MLTRGSQFFHLGAQVARAAISKARRDFQLPRQPVEPRESLEGGSPQARAASRGPRVGLGQEQRDRAEAIRQEVSKQLEDELALREATRALDELAEALESSGAVLDEAELSELSDLIDAVEADLG